MNAQNSDDTYLDLYANIKGSSAPTPSPLDRDMANENIVPSPKVVEDLHVRMFAFPYFNLY